jgi:hypothetical protein
VIYDNHFYLAPISPAGVYGLSWNFGEDENDAIKWPNATRCTDRSIDVPCYHPGVDLTGGYDIHAPIGGTAYSYTHEKDFGTFIILRADDGTCQVFGHMSSFS